MKKLAYIFLIALLLLGATSYAITIPPRPAGFVSDFAKVIDEEQQARIEQLCSSVERQLDGMEIAVVTIPTLEGSSIEDVAVKVFEQWKIGKKEKNNGLLLIVSEKERRVKVEVGYGLEPILTDGLVGELLDRGFVNTFRLTQNYGEAAYNTVTLLALRVAKIEGKKLEGVAPQAARREGSGKKRVPSWWWIISFLLILFFRRGRGGTFWFPGGFGGGGFGGFGGGGGGGFGGFGGGMSGGGGSSRSF